MATENSETSRRKQRLTVEQQKQLEALLLEAEKPKKTKKRKKPTAKEQALIARGHYKKLRRAAKELRSAWLEEERLERLEAKLAAKEAKLAAKEARWDARERAAAEQKEKRLVAQDERLSRRKRLEAEQKRQVAEERLESLLERAAFLPAPLPFPVPTPTLRLFGTKPDEEEAIFTFSAELSIDDLRALASDIAQEIKGQTTPPPKRFWRHELESSLRVFDPLETNMKCWAIEYDLCPEWMFADWLEEKIWRDSPLMAEYLESLQAIVDDESGQTLMFDFTADFCLLTFNHGKQLPHLLKALRVVRRYFLEEFCRLLSQHHP